MDDLLSIQASVPFDDRISLFKIRAHMPYATSSFRTNNEIRILIQHSDSCVVPGFSCLHLVGQLSTQVDSVTARVRFITNGIYHLFRDLPYELNGVEIDRSNNVGLTSFMKGIVSLQKSQEPSFENMGWKFDYTPGYQDGYFDVCIPLSMLLGFAEDHKKILLMRNMS